MDLDNPDLSAVDLRDQCVAFFGVSPRVAVITSSMGVQQDRRWTARPRLVHQAIQPLGRKTDHLDGLLHVDRLPTRHRREILTAAQLPC